MVKLANAEVNKLLTSISILHSDVDQASLPQRTLNSVTNIIANLSTSFDIVSSTGEFIVEENWHEPLELLSQPMLEVFAEYFFEHPIYEVLINRGEGVKRNTDLMSVNEFRKTNLFNEFHSKFDTNYQAITLMPIYEGSSMACAISRDNSDFSDSEMEMLTLLTPHLISAIRNSNVVKKLQDGKGRLESLLDGWQKGAIDFDSEERVLQITESCKRMLGIYFPKTKDENCGIPNVLKNWMKLYEFEPKDEAGFIAPKPFIVERDNSELQVRLIIDARKRRKTLLFEEKRKLLPNSLLSLGVTKREAEVLFLISKGKTSPEISILLDISIYTVHNHTAKIFEKLGVETRVAASQRVHDLNV